MKRILIASAVAASLMSSIATAGYELTINQSVGFKLANGELSKTGRGLNSWQYGFPEQNDYQVFEHLASGVTGFWPEKLFAVMTLEDGTSYRQGQGMPYHNKDLEEIPFTVTDFASYGDMSWYLDDEGTVRYTNNTNELSVDTYHELNAMGENIVGEIVELDASNYNVGMLSDEGVLYTYGYATSGSLGRMNSARLERVDNITAPVVSFAGDAGTWIALDTNGTVWMWGSNSSCQMSNVVQCQTTHLTPQAVITIPNAIKVQVTGSKGYVLDGDGELFAAGNVQLESMATNTLTDFTSINEALPGYNHFVTDIVAESNVTYVKSNDCWYGVGSYDFGTGPNPHNPTHKFNEVECNISDYDIDPDSKIPTQLPAPFEEQSCPIEETVIEYVTEYVDVPGPVEYVTEYVNVEVPVEVIKEVTVEVPVEVIKEVIVEKVVTETVIVEVPVEVEVIKEVIVEKVVTEYVEVAVPTTPNYTIPELKQMLKDLRKAERKAARKAKKEKGNNGHGNGGEGDEVDNGEKYDPSNPGKSKK